MEESKKYTPREAAIAVLAKAKEMLTGLDILAKYESENSPKENSKPSEHNSKSAYQDAEGKGPKGEIHPNERVEGEAGEQERINHQIAPGNNPKEQKEGNNPLKGSHPIDRGVNDADPTGSKPDPLAKSANEFPHSGKVIKRGGEHFVRKDNGSMHHLPNSNHGKQLAGQNVKFGINEHDDAVLHPLHTKDLHEPEKMEKEEELAKKYEGFKAVEESARKSGASNPAAVAASIGRKKYGKEAFQHAAAAGKKMNKDENPDKDADAKLGEKVEHDVEEHMLANKAAEKKEGHKILKKEPMPLPRDIATNHLAKFMKNVNEKRSAKAK